MPSLTTIRAALAACAAVTLVACGQPQASEAPEQLRAEVLETLPHDPTAFTQGFQIVGNTLYESTGLVGESDVRAIDRDSGKELARDELEPPLFGEGIAIVGDRLWQLTWQNEVAIERDRDSLEELRRVSYDGEGWGLCYQDEHERLVMTDGSDALTFRDPDSFAVLDQVPVRAAGEPVEELNELACVEDKVYANVWFSDTIRRIDTDTGEVSAEIDASGLLEPAEAEEADVLNGIAAIPESADEFMLTGKLWPSMFRVQFVPAEP